MKEVDYSGDKVVLTSADGRILSADKVVDKYFLVCFSLYCAKTKGASVHKPCDINVSKSPRCSNNFKPSTFNPVFLSIDGETLIDVVMIVLRIATVQY